MKQTMNMDIGEYIQGKTSCIYLDHESRLNDIDKSVVIILRCLETCKK